MSTWLCRRMFLNVNQLLLRLAYVKKNKMDE